MNAGSLQPTSYDELYRLHYLRVVRLCRLLLPDRTEAEDVAQEVFVKLWQALQTETRAMAWEAWLTRVAVNACRDRRRSGWWKWRRRPHQSDVVDEFAVPDGPSLRPTPEEEVLSRDTCGRIWQAFSQLPARQQEVFALRYIEGWSTEAVASTLGLSTGSVKQHLFRAVRRLRAVIGEDR